MGRTEKALRAWHASPYNFDEFRHPNEVAKTGEGATVYGHGLYVAENPKVSGPGLSQYMSSFQDHPATVGLGGWTIPDDFGGANDRLTLDDSYADGAHPLMAADDEFGQNWVNHFLFERHRDKGALKGLLKWVEDQSNENLANFMSGAVDAGTDYTHDHAQAVREYLEGFGKRPGAIFQKPEDYYQHINREGTGGPFSYEVNVHLTPETMLDWDDLLVNHHSEAFDKLKPLLGQIKSGTDLSGYNAYTMWYHEPSEGLRDGADLYKALTRMHGSDFAASEALYNAGIHGIRYKDAGSRNNWYVGQYTDVNLQPKWGVYSNGGATREAIFDTEAEAREHHAKHAPPVTYNYVIFHPDFVEAIAQYNIMGTKVRDMGPGVHLKAVDHDPFKGEK